MSDKAIAEAVSDGDSPLCGVWRSRSDRHGATEIDVVYVTAERCHFCQRGRAVLDELATRHPLHVREVALTSPEGRSLAARWRAPYPPILLVDGDLAGYGRLSAKAVERVLAARTSAAGGP